MAEKKKVSREKQAEKQARIFLRTLQHLEKLYQGMAEFNYEMRYEKLSAESQKFLTKRFFKMKFDVCVPEILRYARLSGGLSQLMKKEED